MYILYSVVPSCFSANRENSHKHRNIIMDIAYVVLQHAFFNEIFIKEGCFNYPGHRKLNNNNKK